MPVACYKSSVENEVNLKEVEHRMKGYTALSDNTMIKTPHNMVALLGIFIILMTLSKIMIIGRSEYPWGSGNILRAVAELCQAQGLFLLVVS